MKVNNILETLTKLNLVSEQTKMVFSNRTRDIDGLTVYRDSVSGVIFIEEYYDEHVYETGDYREQDKIIDATPSYERIVDAERRFDDYLKYLSNKDILDFGCGAGDFLKKAAEKAKTVKGIELQTDYIEQLNNAGITCVNDIHLVEDNSLDVIFSFHVIEHLPEPIKILELLKSKLRKGGLLIIEVPHAKDFLLMNDNCESFKNFTLWSQHLILHTRESLNKLLNFCGYENVIIKGYQRYPLSNHINWLINGKPGGHKGTFAFFENDDLIHVYESALSSVDMNDTLVAISVKQ